MSQALDLSQQSQTKRKRSKYSKPTYKKKRKMYYPKTIRPYDVTFQSGPLKQQNKVSMVYHDTFTLNTGVGGTSDSYFFSANGLYDPNITGVGHQPRGFDELMALYDHYVVIGCNVTLMANNSDPANSNVVGMFIDDNTTALTDNNEPFERVGVNYAFLGVEAGNATATLSLNVNPGKWLGRSKPLSDPDLKGTDVANPIEQCYIHVWNVPGVATTDTQNTEFHIRIDYTAILIEPKTLIRS